MLINVPNTAATLGRMPFTEKGFTFVESVYNRFIVMWRCVACTHQVSCASPLRDCSSGNTSELGFGRAFLFINQSVNMIWHEGLNNLVTR